MKKIFIIMFLMILSVLLNAQSNFFWSHTSSLPFANSVEFLSVTETSFSVRIYVTKGINDNGLIEYGICFLEGEGTPDRSGRAVIISNNSQGYHDINITGLIAGTIYSYRAFATNQVGIYYDSTESVRTEGSIPTATIPTVESISISNITTNSAILNYNIPTDGGDNITSRGSCWNTTGNPTILSNVNNDGIGVGNYYSNISGLNVSTTYYVRPYATNSIGTAYGSQITFTTLSRSVPTLITNSITSITENSAISGGNTITDGNATIIEKGVCWNTTGTPTYNDLKTNNGSGTSNFTANIINLLPNTTYYVRAYAKNMYDTGDFIVYAVGYGNELSFTTTSSGNVPTLATVSISNITASSAISGGTISSDGGSSITAKGVQWSLNSGFSSIDGSTNDGNGSGNFTSSITGINCGTTYYVRAYATNSSGTGYGNNIVSFMTTSQNSPEYAIFWGIKRDVSCTTISTLDFTSSLSDAQSACSIFNSCGCFPSTCLAGALPRIDSIAIGHKFYTGSDPCTVYPITGYWIDYNGGSTRILYIVSGVIQSITSCP